ncbi:nuclear transport factor 2 family protein [Deinococcus lacus]|uniref:Nuclear transport factor 2 family protein n=1 Tax=Deinococcus lacus TaxID=392561 RepID=A0ABW1YBP3_9DEIO
MTTTQDFMQALQQAESTGDPSALVALHAPDVTLRNLTEKTWEGQEGAQEFWATYLGNFAQIRSEFTRSQEEAGLGVMEWTASGELSDGQPISYRGVSLIEVAGGQVKAFRTYYDSAAFVQPVTTES